MLCTSKYLIGICCVIGAVFLPAEAKRQALPEAEWITMGQPHGVNASVTSCVIDKSGTLFVAGWFSKAGGVATRGIGQWDGAVWKSVGAGLEGPQALAFDGSGNLIAGGRFVDFTPSYRIAWWNGKSWKPFGKGIRGDPMKYNENSVNAIVTGNDGKVYAGGLFDSAGTVAAANIAEWNGTDWTAPGGGCNDTVFALAVDKQGNVYMGGAFDSAGTVAAAHIARWDGSVWTPLGDGLDGEVDALTFDNNGVLYAGGRFTGSGSIAARNTAKWTGSAWEPLGKGVNNRATTLTTDTAGDLIAGGEFDSAGGKLIGNIARWDGSGWNPVGGGPNCHVNSVVADDKGRLFVGGEYDSIHPHTTFISQWTDSVWHSVGIGNSIDEGVVFATVWDSTGNCYIGGQFHSVSGGDSVDNVAKWDGKSWKSVDKGLNGNVYALTITPSGNLLAGGNFCIYPDSVKSNIAEWDGTSWHAFGSGTLGDIYTMAFDHKGDLYVGGYFDTIGGIAAASIAKWDGSQWSALGKGSYGNSVRGIVVDRENRLYATGALGGNTEVVSYDCLARWDGEAWIVCGDMMDSYITSAVIDTQGVIYVGGGFRHAGSLAVHFLAQWDGVKWSSVGSGTNGQVNALAFDKRQTLFAGGKFSFAGGYAASDVARWDGTAWSPVVAGSKVNGSVNALDVSDEFGLVVGGEFDLVDGKWSQDIVFARFQSTGAKSAIGGGAARMPFTLQARQGAVVFNLDAPEQIDFSILSLAGRVEYCFSGRAAAGVHRIVTTRIGLPRGIHIVRFTAGRESMCIRFATIK